MRRFFRRVLVLTITVALVATAGAWRQCVALQLATVAAATGNHPEHAGHHARTASNADLGHSAIHHHDDGTSPVSPLSDDHGCMKCCAMCALTNAVLPPTDAAMMVAETSRLVPHDLTAWTANTVAVDPGIPKRIA